MEKPTSPGPRTCNFAPTMPRHAAQGHEAVPLCGAPATHILPPRKLLVLCEKHAGMAWGTPAPERLP